MSIYIKFKPKSQFSKLILVNCRHLVTKPNVSVDENDEYTKEPQYPPILETGYKATKERSRLQWHEKIKCLKTVEEKLFAINMPRYYGFKCVMLNDHMFRYNSLPFFQYSTRTSLFDSGLPDYYNKLNEKVDGLLGHIKSDVEDAVLFEYTGYRYVTFNSRRFNSKVKLTVFSLSFVFALETKRNNSKSRLIQRPKIESEHRG